MGITRHIGLILNPMAGRDIRRLVAFASLQSTPEKLLVVRRILAGISVYRNHVDILMPGDYEGLSSLISDEAKHQFGLRVAIIGELASPSSADTTRWWADQLQDAGADLIIAIGGDGTQRNIAQANPMVPILPIAGGTNNVACWNGDQTAAGYAAGLYVTNMERYQHTLRRAKIIHVATGDKDDLALIDVAMVRQNFTGALAVWNPEDVVALALTVADPTRPGLSNVGGYVEPLTPEGDAIAWIDLGDSQSGSGPYYGVLAPGLMTPFYIAGHRKIALNQEVVLPTLASGGSLALDGERTIVLRPGQHAMIQARRDGPQYILPDQILGIQIS